MKRSKYLNLQENKVNWGLGDTRPHNWNLKMFRACFMSIGVYSIVCIYMYTYVKVKVLVTSQGVTANGYGVSSWDRETILKVTMLKIIQF